MQYVRNLSDSISTTWNSINPATLSGAIDVIVVEQEDGTLACSPFHVRFGKFSLLRPYEKKVEFKVNGAKQEYAMKLGEGGEAFFVFETADTIPQSLQTSPLVSPVSSPPLSAQGQRHGSTVSLHEVESLDLNDDPANKPRPQNIQRPPPAALLPRVRDGMLTPRTSSPELSKGWSPRRPYSDDVIRKTARKQTSEQDLKDSSASVASRQFSDRSRSPPSIAPAEAMQRAMTLSEELSAVNIPTHITETGDLMLDMTGFKDNDEDALRAELLARKVLTEELHGNYDIGALFGMDEHGNLWIYSSEEAKDAAELKRSTNMRPNPTLAIDAASDPGYNSDGTDATGSPTVAHHRRAGSDVGHDKDIALQTPPRSPGSPAAAAGDPNRNYAKTLRLTSDQLKALNLKAGENSMSFTVNRATCSAFMYLWKHDVPMVISDIDGTITKSDALGHVMNMIGRDWTHAGVAKLYSDIVANGFNIMYLTSRSVGQSDTTRAYLAGILQDGYRLPRGPTILSPDRTIAALRREVYLRKPEVFKMSALRDIRALYGNLDGRTPFYAGFGNRLTDQLSYRAVSVPQSRIFTINTNAEVSLDLLSLNRLKLSYVNMTEVVDHYFPPVSTLVKGGGDEYTDFTYWRDTPLELDEFSASETDGEGADEEEDVEYEEDEEDLLEEEDVYDEDEEELVEDGGLGESYISRESLEYEDGGSEGDDEGGPEEDEAEVEFEDDEPANPLNVLTKDVSAELITGVKNLSMEKGEPQPEAVAAIA